MSSALTIVACVLAALTIVAPRASAAVGDPFLDSCVALNAQGPCAAGAGPSSATAVALHPSGKWLYVATQTNGDTSSRYGITIYDRNPVTGALTRHPGTAGCVTSDGSGGGCGTASSLNSWVYDLEQSADGRNLYVPVQSGNLLIFDVDQATGALTQKPGGAGCLGTGANCTPLRGSSGMYAAATDRIDGTSLYVRVNNGLLAFTRDTATGALTQKAGAAGCFTESPVSTCTDAVGLGADAYQLQVSPDGHQLYTSESIPGGVTIFQRFTDGTLMQPTGTAGGCISKDGTSNSVGSSCIHGSDTLTSALSVSLDPAGKNVYVGGTTGLVAYARNAASGLLTEVACYRDGGGGGCGARNGSAALHSAVTPDGSQLLTSAYFSGKAGFLVRDTTGALTNRPGTRGCLSGNGTAGACDALPALDTSISDVAVSSDGQFAYLTSTTAGMVATLHFDAAPVCDAGSVTVTAGTPAAIPLHCTDRNGDPLTLEIARAPLTGQLGAIDQSNRRVVYAPSAGFTGDDSFEYRAVGNGTASAPATVSVKVLAGAPADQSGGGTGGGGSGGGGAPKPPASTPKPAASLSTSFPSSGSRTRVGALTLSKLVAGDTVRVSCRGKGCPFTTKTAKVSKGKANLLALFGKKRLLPAGAVLEIRVTHAGAPTRVWRYTMRKGKSPKVTNGCIAAGASKLGPC
jgi:6-phosphogluconolactonase (cycloisomerase 2 family)